MRGVSGSCQLMQQLLCMSAWSSPCLLFAVAFQLLCRHENHSAACSLIVTCKLVCLPAAGSHPCAPEHLQLMGHNHLHLHLRSAVVLQGQQQQQQKHASESTSWAANIQSD